MNDEVMRGIEAASRAVDIASDRLSGAASDITGDSIDIEMMHAVLLKTSAELHVLAVRMRYDLDKIRDDINTDAFV